MGGQAQGGHGHGQQQVVQLHPPFHQRPGQHTQRVDAGHHHKAQRKPGQADTAQARGLCRAVPAVLAGLPQCQQQQEGRQHHHPHHLGDHGGAGGLGADGRARRHHLGHLVHGGAHVQAVALRVHGDPAVVGVPLVQRRVQEHAHGAEHHHGGDGHGHILGVALGHRGRGQHGRCATDGAARTDQQAGAPVQAQQALAQQAGQAEGAGQHQGIQRNAAPADLGDVLEGQAQAVQHDAGAQQLLFGQAHAGATGGGQARVDGVAQQQAQHDGQGEGAEPVCGRPGLGRQPQGQQGDGGAQQQAGGGAAQPLQGGIEGEGGR